MNRRHFLGVAGAGAIVSGLSGCGPAKLSTAAAPRIPSPDAFPPIMPVHARADRIFRVTVCLRPFRAAGPRLEVESVGDKTVVHNYGHGGSGWSLSWGSSAIAVEHAMAAAGGEREVAVIGCGALGLTSAILLQRAGARVTIYAKERPPDVRSARATGSWTPDSRIALANSASPDFPALWEKMCRSSFQMYQSYLGMAGNPVEWTDRYSLYDRNSVERHAHPPTPQPQEDLEFAHYMNRVRDLTPRATEFGPGTHPFPTQYATRTASLTFNV
ncbi:MAG TPA: FAD-dependent oxidoreductase, partial [Bryobacteraceae bacterium]